MIVWTTQAHPYIFGVRYGVGRDAGRRHMRIGFANDIQVGSVLVSGGGTLSVLKAEAAYPGALDDDSQWIAAERLVDGRASSAEVAEGHYGLWVLPEGTAPALRFSHVPAPGDPELSVGLGGVWILPQRWGNVAPQSLVQTRARDDASAKIVDESHNRTWQTWDNAERGPLPVSAEHPELVTLTWPKPVTLGGVCLLWTGFEACEIEALVGGDEANVQVAPASSWKQVATGSGLRHWYPISLGPNWVPFAEAVSTRALRLRITAPAKAGHPHLEDKVKDGRRVWLGELIALAPLGGAELASLVLPKAVAEPPPIPVKFRLPEAGLVTLVIEDQQGKRVRNLVSETPFPAGERRLVGRQRRPAAPRRRPARPVSHPAAGRPAITSCAGFAQAAATAVRVQHLQRGKARLEHGRQHGLLADDAYAADERGRRARLDGDGQPLVFMGCYVAEGGHGLQWLREDGTKIGGQHWVGGTWTGAPTLAVDLGQDAVAEHLCYVGAVWEGELRLTAKTRSLGDQPVFKTKLGDDPRPQNPTDPRPQLLKGFEGGDREFVLSAIAAHNGTIVCSLLRGK